MIIFPTKNLYIPILSVPLRCERSDYTSNVLNNRFLFPSVTDDISFIVMNFRFFTLSSVTFYFLIFIL